MDQEEDFGKLLTVDMHVNTPYRCQAIKLTKTSEDLWQTKSCFIFTMLLDYSLYLIPLTSFYFGGLILIYIILN